MCCGNRQCITDNYAFHRTHLAFVDDANDIIYSTILLRIFILLELHWMWRTRARARAHLNLVVEPVPRIANDLYIHMHTDIVIVDGGIWHFSNMLIWFFNEYT